MNKEKSAPRSAAYTIAGVDLASGDDFGKYCGKVCEESYGNSPFVRVHDSGKGNHRRQRSFNFVGLPREYRIVTAPDGTGTKTIFYSADNSIVDDCSVSFDKAGTDPLAMTAGDITRWGGLPLVFVNQLDVKSLGEPKSPLRNSYLEMIHGLGQIAREQQYVLINGETAQMGVCVGTELDAEALKEKPAFNWCGTMIGVSHPKKEIDGSTIKSGQSIIALRDGLRSNGASLCRRFLRSRFGDAWWNNPKATETVHAMAKPSVLYDLFLATINGWYHPVFETEIKVPGIAHLSGGGIGSKLGDGLLFPGNFGARLDNLFEPPQFMKDCIAEFGMGDEEAYSVFNGGQGALVIVDANDARRFIARASEFRIEACHAGTIVEQNLSGGWIEVFSKFSGKRFVIEEKSEQSGN